MHGCSNVLNCNDGSHFLLMADLFHSFHTAPHSGGLHLRNANQQNEVSPVQRTVQSIRGN